MNTEYPIGDEFNSSLSAAVSLGSVPEGTSAAEIQAIAQNIRFRLSTTPTATNGGVIYAGEVRRFPWAKAGLEKLRFIEESSGAALHAVYVRG